MFDITTIIKTGTFSKGGFIKRIGKDQLFFRKDDIGEDMYIIISGKVRILVSDKDEESVIAELGAGDLFGEMAFLEKLPRSTAAKAAEDTLALVVNSDNFDKIMRRNPGIALSIMKVLSSRIRSQNELLYGKKKKQPSPAPEE